MGRVRTLLLLTVFFTAIGALLTVNQLDVASAGWTEAQLRLLRSLQLRNLPAWPEDPSNRVSDDPDAAEFGHRLFFDSRLSVNGRVACSNCHQPERFFTDALPVSVGIGRVERNAPTLVGVAYSPWFFWDGRKDSLWSQATAPLENPLEHGAHRWLIARVIATDEDYRRRYRQLFGELPDLLQARKLLDPDPSSMDGWSDLASGDRQSVTEVFVNAAKALAAYQTRLRPGPSRFDAYVATLGSSAAAAATVEADLLLSAEERRGLKLFIGRAQCVQCHNGPMFSNHSFHNTGSLSAPGQLPSRGRIRGLATLLEDPFNCLGAFSDDPQKNCAELRFVKRGDELLGAHRTPSLRNVSKTAPYMHAGQLATLEAVVAQYNRGAAALIGHNEAKPLGLSARDRAALVAFLKTLDGPIDTDPRWLRAPESDG